MTFIDDDSARVGTELTLSLQTLLGAVKRAEKALKFLGMGCEDSGSAKGVLPKELEAVFHLREHVEGVGIEDQGFELRGFEKAAKRQLAVGSQSGANGHGIVALEVGGGEEAGEMGVVVIDGDHGFGHGNLHDIHAVARHMDGEQTDPRPEAGPGGKNGSPHFAIAASNEEGVSESAFVTVGNTMVEKRGEDRLIHQDGIVVDWIHGIGVGDLKQERVAARSRHP